MKRSIIVFSMALGLLVVAALRVNADCFKSCIAETCMQKTVNGGLLWHMQVQNNATCRKLYWDIIDYGTICNGSGTVKIRRMQSSTANCTTPSEYDNTAPRRAQGCLYFHADDKEYTVGCCESCTYD